MLQVSMEQITKAMPLRRAVKAALRGETNAEQAILAWLMSYEAGDWELCDAIARATGRSQQLLPEIYTAAVVWAEQST